MKAPNSLIPFLFLSLMHLVGQATGQEMLHVLTKPLLMPALVFFFWKECPKTPLNRFIYGALMFSWLGDTFLIFSEQNGLFFMAGLGSFLVAHIIYVIININFTNDGQSKLIFKWPSAIFIIYGMVVFSLLIDSLGSLTLPVAIYTSVICIMGMTAFGRKNRTSETDFRLVMAGALFFILSDTLLAFNKFNAPIAQAGLLVMLTYLVAQLLLVLGYLKFIEGLKSSE